MKGSQIHRVPPVSVLTYHNIVACDRENPNDTHSISIKRLNEHIEALANAGFVQLSLADAFEIVVNVREHKSRPGYVLTFDDGYVSLSTYRNDIISPLRPTVFVITGYAGLSTLSWNTRSSVVLNHLTADDISKLHDCSFDIQLHGCDHHNLLKFDDDQLRMRFEEADRWFIRLLGKSAAYLSYPYGYCDARIQKVVSEFYSGAVSISHGVWTGEAARYALNRVSIPYYLTGSDVVTILRMMPDQRWLEIEKRAPWRI